MCGVYGNVWSVRVCESVSVWNMCVWNVSVWSMRVCGVCGESEGDASHTPD